MSGFSHATPAVLVLMIVMIAPLFLYMRRARAEKSLFVRRIAGIDAIEEASGRAAELGQPIVFTTGLTLIGPILYACLGVLSFIARKAAQYKSKLLLPQYNPEVMAVAEDVAREAYRIEGRQALFDARNIIFLSDEQFAFAAGYIGLVQREKIASAFLFGEFAAESLILAEAGQQVGAMQIAATVRPEQVAFFIAACDYTLIGEELFAASAYLSREPIQLASLYAQDRAKCLFLGMIVIGVLIATLNSVWPELQIPNLDRLLYYSMW